MAVTLTVDKFGLDSQVFGFGEKVHSARGLHATAGAVAKFSRCRKRIAVFNSKAVPGVPREPMPGERLSIYVRNVSFPAIETGRRFHVNGITVNKTTQTVESAAGGAFHIEDVYPLIDGGRFPVKRIVGERVEVWADIYRDGHDVVSRGAGLAPRSGTANGAASR